MSKHPGEVGAVESLLITAAAVRVPSSDGDRERPVFESSTTVDSTLIGAASELIGEVELDTREYETMPLDATQTF